MQYSASLDLTFSFISSLLLNSRSLCSASPNPSSPCATPFNSPFIYVAMHHVNYSI
ncbi:hypothetical protein Fmac_005744 [Flemingia macrophylla]|uniref:Uncharacterized protein n=1 Tax=Flemingia macrophylla TaxID=520843 RepID=A0ABD1N8S7_9FABA